MSTATEQILSEIREANLSYLMLAQHLIRTDRPQALFRLGISDESADMIVALSPAQMHRLATGNTLLCRLRTDDELVWSLLTTHGMPDSQMATTRLHASLQLAGR